MFRQSLNAISAKAVTAHFRWSRLILTAAAMLAGGAAMAAPSMPNYGRDDAPAYEDIPGRRAPGNFERPYDNRDDFPGNPSNDDLRHEPHRFRTRDPDSDAPRHHVQPDRGAPEYRDHDRREHEHRDHGRRDHERGIHERRGHEEDNLPEPELIQRKLTSRYANPAVVRLERSISPERSLELYTEVSTLIDARHLHPSTYDARVKQAAKNLCQAVDNRAFLQANNVPDDRARIDTFRNEMLQLVNSQPISGRDEASQALQWAMRAAERDLGLRPSTVAIEFVFGATDSLDKYSGFVPAMDRASPSVELEDHIVGIGVEIKTEERGLVVARALPGGPAAEAGLQSGDLIESVNGQKLAGNSVEYAVDLIAGPAGSRVTLGVRRDERLADVTLARRRVEVHSVSDVEMLEGNVGYIKLEKFAQNSSEEFDKALWGLYRQGMKSLIVDVRGNPGGLLTTAIQLSNKFVPSGTIVATRGRDASDNMVERAHKDQTWKTPLVVLVDENSASASEIFAAAVQENGRGLIVGRRTYGKGTVQTHFPLQTVSGNLRLTTAQFFSPNGRVMAGAGVEPDVRVEADEQGRHAFRDREDRLGHEPPYGREGFHHQEAAYRHDAGYRPASPHGPDRDIAAALEAATSRQVLDMAVQAGNRNGNRRGAVQYPEPPLEN